MENPSFTASYHRHGSQEKLVTRMEDEDDDDEYEEEEDDELQEEEYVQVSIPKHIRFVTDASLSSWSDPEKAWQEKSSCLGYVLGKLF